MRVFNLVVPPTAILRPHVAAKVLRQAITRRSGAGSQGPDGNRKTDLVAVGAGGQTGQP